MAPSYIIQRALYAVPIAIGVTVICFALIYLGPVDPVAAVTPDDATPEQIAMIRAAYGFDRPLPAGERAPDPDLVYFEDHPDDLEWIVRASENFRLSK